MKVSVCITVLNEEASIAGLLDSLLNQTQKPDEIVIVDAASTDKTVEIIRHFQKKDKRIKLLQEKGSIAHARNISIELAKNEIIAITDAGCIAKSDWLEKIVYPFKFKNIGISAGFYEMPYKTSKNQAINVFHGVPVNRFDSQNFLPSTRSAALRKQVWSEIGGFNEKLDKAGEDTEFFCKAVKNAVKIARNKEARVVWNEIGSLSLNNSLKKLYGYAIGDVQTGIWRHPIKHFASHNLKALSIFGRYFLGLILVFYSFSRHSIFYLLLILVICYLFWSVWKWRDVVTNWNARIWLPVIQILSDFAVMLGFLEGVRKKYLSTRV